MVDQWITLGLYFYGPDRLLVVLGEYHAVDAPLQGFDVQGFEVVRACDVYPVGQQAQELGICA